MTLDSNRKLFLRLFNAGTEKEIDNIFSSEEILRDTQNWHPLGKNFSNYGVIENQQSNPIAALIEKITNSIDATLMKKCYESGIDPKSPNAPQSMTEAIEKFYGGGKNWDINHLSVINSIAFPSACFLSFRIFTLI
jgi:hypothetical protein